MERVEEVLRKYTILLQICLMVIATCFLSIGINRPLADYDEATYAKVTVDTLQSGDVLSFTLSGNHWYEKPPLLLWLTMGSVKLFGTHEFAFRIPSILASILCLWLTYLIARELADSELAGVAAFLVLLSSPIFFYFARELRLDSSVLAAVLAAFWCWVKAFKDERYLFWIFPFAAIGFLSKSVIVLLLGLILFIYSAFYQKWVWLKNKYFWYGFPLAVIIFVPWHAIQIVRFGNEFLNRYLGYDVYKRATTAVNGGGNYYDYIKNMWSDATWLIVLVSSIVFFVCITIFGKKLRSLSVWKTIAAPLVTFVSIIILFSIAKTHLTPYIIPAYPFIAIFMALLAYYVSENYEKRLLKYLLIVLPFIFIGFIYCVVSHINPTPAYVPDEVEIGQVYKKSNTTSASVYSLEWYFLETLNYYGNTKVEFIGSDMSGKELKGPFYLIVPGNGLNIFYTIQNDAVVTPYKNIHLVYKGQYLSLLYFDSSIVFPVFNYQK